jgi:hypothetical protein
MEPDERDRPRKCSLCGSDRLIGIEGEYATGVVAPDGYAERWRYVGVKCLNCGEEEEC